MYDSELLDAGFNPSTNRTNLKQVIAKRGDLLRYDGGRMAPSVSGYFYAGQVVGFATTGGDAGFYKPYNPANSDGSQNAVGILKLDANIQPVVAPSVAGYGSEVAIIKGGDVFSDMLIGLDSAAIISMNGKLRVEHGSNILHFNC